MAKNEVGEFELVLGNKQLLSVFFFVVILLGVFFTMGYIVGRNSGGVGTLEAGNHPKPTSVESPNTPAPTAVSPATETPAAEPPKPEPKKEEPKPPPPVVEPKPVEKPKPEEKKAVEEKKKDDKKKKDKAEAPAPAPSGALSGTYLQLAAVPKSEADLLISVLRKKGFGAAAGPGPEGSNLFRVLVGPLAGADAVSKTRTSLNDAGMPGTKALVRKF